MENAEIKALIEAGIPGVEARVKGDGSHYEAIVIGDCFEGKSMVNQQKMVYAVLNEHITSGAIHALSIKTYTPEKWETAKLLQVGGE
ncbi:MAG: BolA family protein [Gammaproteobacteria bacterium]|jgi:acid stress-induced BolA-like protein IbaG/YrbA